MRTAGRAFGGEKDLTEYHPTITTLTATGIISALGAITRQNHYRLSTIAKQQGHSKPRLLLRAERRFIKGLRGDEAHELTLNEQLKDNLDFRLNPYEVFFEEAEEKDATHDALISFGTRALIHRYDDLKSPEYVPHVFSTQWSEPPAPPTPAALLTPAPPPLTPKYEGIKNAQQ
jgi:hypothetical protein